MSTIATATATTYNVEWVVSSPAGKAYIATTIEAEGFHEFLSMSSRASLDIALCAPKPIPESASTYTATCSECGFRATSIDQAWVASQGLELHMDAHRVFFVTTSDMGRPERVEWLEPFDTREEAREWATTRNNEDSEASYGVDWE